MRLSFDSIFHVEKREKAPDSQKSYFAHFCSEKLKKMESPKKSKKAPKLLNQVQKHLQS